MDRFIDDEDGDDDDDDDDDDNDEDDDDDDEDDDEGDDEGDDDGGGSGNCWLLVDDDCGDVNCNSSNGMLRICIQVMIW